MVKPDKVILDTNILQYGVGRTLSDEIADLLPKMEERGLGLVISSFSIFEVYRGLNKKKIAFTRELVSKITPLEPDTITFKVAAALYSCYHSHEATKDRNQYDDDGDIVIASTAIRYNAAILTGNGNDFPRPFFDEMDRYVIHRDSDKAEIVIHLLQPNIHTFNKTMKDCLL